MSEPEQPYKFQIGQKVMGLVRDEKGMDILIAGRVIARYQPNPRNDPSIPYRGNPDTSYTVELFPELVDPRGPSIRAWAVKEKEIMPFEQDKFDRFSATWRR